jgi:hypothetical protein
MSYVAHFPRFLTSPQAVSQSCSSLFSDVFRLLLAAFDAQVSTLFTRCSQAAKLRCDVNLQHQCRSRCKSTPGQPRVSSSQAAAQSPKQTRNNHTDGTIHLACIIRFILIPSYPQCCLASCPPPSSSLLPAASIFQTISKVRFIFQPIRLIVYHYVSRSVPSTPPSFRQPAPLLTRQALLLRRC